MTHSFEYSKEFLPLMSSSLDEESHFVASSQPRNEGLFPKLLDAQKSKQMLEEGEDKENKGNILRPSPVSSCMGQRPLDHKEVIMTHDIILHINMLIARNLFSIHFSDLCWSLRTTLQA